MLGYLILVIIYVSAFIAIFCPWIGVCAGYFINVLGPQYIWWWVLGDQRIFLVVAVPTIIGFIIEFLRGRIIIDSYKIKGNIFLFLYFLFLFLSYFFGPWVDKKNEFTLWNPHTIFVNFLKIFIFYYIAIGLINSSKRCIIFSFILPLAAFYLVYWAHVRYFSGYQFLRLSGPMNPYGSGIYRDENQFAMLFVLAIPFLFYLGLSMQRIFYRIMLWSLIPLCWHAIFLTASRGGLLGIVLTLLVIAIRLKKFLFLFFIIPSFFIFYHWQGGIIMKKRFETIHNYKEEKSAAGRIQIWKNTFKLIRQYPLFGTGLGSYHYAYPVIFNYDKPRVAHNTFLQILGESGIFAFLAYLASVVSFLFSILRTSKILKQKNFFLWSINEACFASLVGFLFVSFFLTLNGFEVFFYLLVIASALNVLSIKTSNL